MDNYVQKSLQILYIKKYHAMFYLEITGDQEYRLQQVMVNGMVIKVCGYGIRGHIVGGMLHRGEGVDILS